MAKPITPTAEYLAHLERQYRAARRAADRCSLSQRARLRCERDGVPVPEWAKRRRARRTRGTDPYYRSESSGDLNRSPQTRATPLEIPPELSTWRAAHEGAAVVISRTGEVVLDTPTWRKTFPSVTAALAFID